MSEGMDLLGSKEAAKYLGMAESTLTWHVGKGHVKPRKIAGALIFTRAQLDEFKRHPLFRQRKPRKPRDNPTGQ